MQGLTLASLCLLLFALVGITSAEFGQLMVAKNLKEEYIVIGRNLTIEFTFHNIGDG